MKAPLILMASFGLLLGACASDPDRPTRTEMREAEYERFAGAEVDRIRAFNLYGWTVLDREKLVLWTRPNEAFIVELDRACPNLEFARKIGISNFGNTIHARFDSIIVNRDRCRIESIRTVDAKALRAERKRMRYGGDLETRPED